MYTPPWKLGGYPRLKATETRDNASIWVTQKIEETNLTILTGAIIAAVASAALSWQTVETWPWTVHAAIYSSLTLSLVSVYTGTQQSIALIRFGRHYDGGERIKDFLSNHKFQGWVWSVPLILLNISILLIVIGIWISIWDAAARNARWGDEMKIAFVSSIAGFFALFCMLLSMLWGVYILPPKYTPPANPGPVLQGQAQQNVQTIQLANATITDATLANIDITGGTLTDAKIATATFVTGTLTVP